MKVNYNRRISIQATRSRSLQPALVKRGTGLRLHSVRQRRDQHDVPARILLGVGHENMPDHLRLPRTANIVKGAQTFLISFGNISTPHSCVNGPAMLLKVSQAQGWCSPYEALRVLLGCLSAPLRFYSWHC